MGLCASTQGTLIPAASTSGWHEVALTTQEFAAAVRVVLSKLGCTAEQLENIGAHSMKCTVLLWSAKAGLPRHSRRLLGYHIAPGDKTMEIYSRDSMAAPLRDLDKLLESIRAGAFLPDATRSGMLPAAGVPDDADGENDGVAINVEGSAASSTCASSRSSTSSIGSLFEDAGGEVETFMGQFVYNSTTRVCHISDTQGKLRCGRGWPKAYEVIADAGAAAPLCPRCF